MKSAVAVKKIKFAEKIVDRDSGLFDRHVSSSNQSSARITPLRSLTIKFSRRRSS